MTVFRRTSAALFALIAAAWSVSGQTITVTTSADVSDVPSSATLAALPGPDGVVSFREALLVSDNERGRQTIGFAIPQADWYLSSLFPGQVLIQGSLSWSAADTVTIDGTTQTAFTGDTFPGGNEIVLYGLTLSLTGDGGELLGLHESRVTLYGSGCDVHDNTGGMYITLHSGSGSIVHDNEAWTIALTQSDDNVVVRNTTERVRITGAGTSFAAQATGNRIGGPDVADRNFITGFGNYGEHGVPSGDCMELFYTADTLIQNNYIGTTPDGMAISNPACTVGIALYSGNDDVAVRDNLMAIHATYSGGVGRLGQEMYIELVEGGDGIEITGNTMGLNALGQPLLGGANGIWVSRYVFEEGADVRIGGAGPGQGNVIAGHGSTGVLMMNGPGIPPVGSVRLSGNSIHANDAIDVDLMPNTWTFGPTANDPLDADDGANGLQNYPQLLAAALQGASVHVLGTLDSEPLQSYTIEVFASPACHPSGFGPARLFLGTTSVFTDAAGHAAFEASFPGAPQPGWVLTSTATHEPLGTTSELSACVPVQALPRFRRLSAGTPRLLR